MRTILLWRRGGHKLNADTLLNPPNAQLGQPAKGVGGKRGAVVHSDDIGHPMVAHQFFEDAQRALELLVGAGVTANNIAAVAITDGQRIAALAVRQDKPTLEVYGPYLVGAARLREVIRSNAMHADLPLGLLAEAMSVQR